MTEKSLHIALVLPTYLPESFGGAEQQTRKLAMFLVRRGFRVTLLAPRLLASTPAQEEKDGIRIRRFRVASPPNLGGRHLPSFLWWSLQTGWWLWRNRRDYDLIHIIHGRLHAVGPLLAGKFAAKKPTIVKLGRGGVEHFDIDLVHGKRLVGPLYSRVIRRDTTAFVANSAQIAADLERHGIGPDRIFRIANGVILPEAEEGSTPRTPGETRFIYFGRLAPEKGLDLMVQGFARLPPDRGARLVIVGDGESRAGLERLVADLGLAARVEFTGKLDDVSPQLRKADFYLSTSLSEGMSNSLLEAMSYGIVPIVTRVSGVEDMVANGESGLLFEPGDEASFAHALGLALDLDPERRRAMGGKAMAAMESRFGMAQITDQHIALYRQLLKQAGGTGYE